MRVRVCSLKMIEDPWSTEVATQHPSHRAGLIDDSGSAISNPPVAIRRGRRLSPRPRSFLRAGLCCQSEYRRCHVGVHVALDLRLRPGWGPMASYGHVRRSTAGQGS